jgi:hypothetical protein
LLLYTAGALFFKRRIMRTNPFLPASKIDPKERIEHVLSFAAERVYLILTQQLPSLEFRVKREVLFILLFS